MAAAPRRSLDDDGSSARSARSSGNTRVHVQRIATLTRRPAAHPHYSSYGFPALPSPWGRPEILPGEAEIAPLLAEFDGKVVPWLRGKLSASGETRDAFLHRLDAVAATHRPDAAKAAALARVRARSSNSAEEDNRMEEAMAGAGFLRTRERWAETTIRSYRKTLRAMATRAVLHACSRHAAAEPNSAET